MDVKAEGDALMKLSLSVALLVFASSAGAAERYVSASVDVAGNLRILTADRRSITIAKDVEQVGFDKISISPDGTAVGWLGLRTNCCTSYPIPTRLFLYTAGERRSFIGIDLPVWNWRFTDGGMRVAFHQETVHGGLGTHYELRDVASGALIAEWEPAVGPDNQQLPDQMPPAWVIELNKQP